MSKHFLGQPLYKKISYDMWHILFFPPQDVLIKEKLKNCPLKKNNKIKKNQKF